MSSENSIVLKVAADSNAPKVAISLIKNLQAGKTVEMLAIGAGAVNQMVKGAAIAGKSAAREGCDFLVKPAFEDVSINGEQKTGMKLVIVRQ